MAPTPSKQEAQNPLLLRSHRLMEAFAKSDDERDFYLDRMEGYLIYIDLDKSKEELEALEKELVQNKDRYCQIPKLTFYETKKIMEGFVNEKVYDIDTKEKLLDIIQSKEARSNFLEFIYDHHTELEKWQQFYQERSRIRIIEWLRNNHFHFVFEEDLEMTKQLIEKLKASLFQTKVGKDIIAARKVLYTKAKTYYSNEALNPRPKRGRPPKQAVKQEIEPQVTIDIYTTVPSTVRPFLFTPDIISASAVTFSSKFEGEGISLTQKVLAQLDVESGDINQKLASLRTLSSRWVEKEAPVEVAVSKKTKKATVIEDWDDEEDEDEDIDDEDFDDEDEDEEDDFPVRSKIKPPVKMNGVAALSKAKVKPAVPTKPLAKVVSKSVVKPKPVVKSRAVVESKPTTKVSPAAKVKVKPKIAAKKSAPVAKKSAPVREKKTRIIPKAPARNEKVTATGKVKVTTHAKAQIKTKKVPTKSVVPAKRALSVNKKVSAPAKKTQIIAKKPLKKPAKKR